MKQPFEIHAEIHLRNFDPSFCDGMDKEEACKKTAKFCEQIGDFQELLYANSKHAVLILLQGMDASGKDGAIRRVLECVNPAGVETANFKQPSHEERAHDFLWRAHKAVPRLGNIGVFNRSHYEDVVIVRVLGLQPSSVWRRRYEQINAFERILTLNGVILLKFFLHINKEEQAHWNGFQRAYEDAINRCSTEYAPWHIVPANRKWYRDYVIARTLAHAFETLRMKWPKPVEDLSKIKFD